MTHFCSSRVTHFCSFKVIHTDNTICHGARPFSVWGTLDIIHAAGVLFELARLFLRQGLRVRLLKTRLANACPTRRPIWRFLVGKLHHLGAVLGHFWRAYPGHFPRAPKPDAFQPMSEVEIRTVIDGDQDIKFLLSQDQKFAVH